MSSALLRFLDHSVGLFGEVLPFFAGGVLLAGFLKAYGNVRGVASWLTRSRGSIVLGSLLGCVVPVCSCGAVPLALGLLAAGVAPGPVFAFLAAAPMVNPASFLMTAGVMGYELAVGRFAGAVFLGTAVGFVMQARGARGLQPPAAENAPCACAPGPPGSRFLLSWFLAGQIYISLVPYVAAGVILGGVIAVTLDPTLVARSLTGAYAIPAAAAAGVPLYLCSCAEVPVALSLVRKGVEPAAILTFLLAGPGVSIFSVVLLSSVLRIRMLVWYVLAFLGASTFLGFLWKGLAG